MLTPLELLFQDIMAVLAFLEKLRLDLLPSLLLDLLLVRLTGLLLLGSLDESPLAVAEIVGKTDAEQLLTT